MQPPRALRPFPCRTGAAERFTERYYTDKALRFGATPSGVDWTCAATQQMRFVQLLRVCDFGRFFTLNDLGCGYGALLDFLAGEHPPGAVQYRGTDLSAEMVRLGRERHPGACFSVGNAPAREGDYTVASGIFNVRPGQDTPRATHEWEHVVAATLDGMAAGSARGFAVNFLARAPGPALYATTPERWAGHCRDRFGAAVEVVVGYGLAEFTLLVRRRGAPASAARRFRT